MPRRARLMLSDYTKYVGAQDSAPDQIEELIASPDSLWLLLP